MAASTELKVWLCLSVETNSFPWETEAIIIFVFSCHVILLTLLLRECCGCAKNICIMTWIFYLTCAFLCDDSSSHTHTHTLFSFNLLLVLFTKKRRTDQIFPLGYFCFSFVRLSPSHKHASHYFFFYCQFGYKYAHLFFHDHNHASFLFKYTSNPEQL